MKHAAQTIPAQYRSPQGSDQCPRPWRALAQALVWEGPHAGPLAPATRVLDSAPVNLVIGDFRPRKWSKS